MRILVIGAGGVGSAAVPILARRAFFDHVVVADFDPDRARRAVDRAADARFSAARVDASDAAAVAALARASAATHVLNAVDPRFVIPIFEGALAAGADYLDMAMSLSRPSPSLPRCSRCFSGRPLGIQMRQGRARPRSPSGRWASTDPERS